MEKFGLKAEGWIQQLLSRAGYEVVPATQAEDRILKVDFWVEHDGNWLPVQFSVDKEAIVSGKGVDALHRGIIPMWMDSQELEIAHWNGNGAGLVREFWNRVEKIQVAYPVKRFPTPNWTCTQTR